MQKVSLSVIVSRHGAATYKSYSAHGGTEALMKRLTKSLTILNGPI